MCGVTIQARHSVAKVFTAPEVQPLSLAPDLAFVAFEADGGSCRRRETVKPEHPGGGGLSLIRIESCRFVVFPPFEQPLRGLVILQVLLRRSVAGFATMPVHRCLPPECLAMCRDTELGRQIRMAFRTGIATHVLIGIGRSRRRRFSLLLG